MRMRDLINLCEMPKRKRRVTPAEEYIAAVKHKERCTFCTLEQWDANAVHLAWLETDGQSALVPFLTGLADQLGVTLVLSVEVHDTGYGGKLIGYYQKHGFEIDSSDFDDDFDFLNMEPSDRLQGTVGMERKPRPIP